ncbi:hypothetical protein VTL71DRAFT_15108 [Oculimacula yallundae]|uniref:Zn(2)-C6 fungal-type domain-containing protein n=1 Tax=Oculimacula yallundae TaxID=86028 RepID=A0ABR4CG79_9HELO
MSYDAHAAYVLQPGRDMDLFDVDLIMQDLLDESPDFPPAHGSTTQSFPGSWDVVGNLSSTDWDMEDCTDSGVMIRQHPGQTSKAYLNESNAFLNAQTDDSATFPTRGSEIAGEWIDGANFMVDSNSMAENLPYDPEFLLKSLASPEPRPIHNHYEGYSSGYGDPASPDMQNYVYSVAPAQIPNHGAVRSHSDKPWSHVDPQMSQWTSGYVLNLPSPGPQGEIDSDGSPKSGDSSEIHSPQPQKLRHVKTRRPQGSSGKKLVKEKRKPIELTWEHAAFTKGWLSFVPETGTEEDTHRNGVRNGPLDSEVKEKAKRMRQLKACWKCWIQKVPCTEGKTCERCVKIKQASSCSPNADQFCCRQGFKDYVPVFFPEFLHYHLDKHVIENLVSTHTRGFLDGVITVEVSTGAAFSPMILRANVFQQRTEELLRQARLITGKSNNIDLALVECDSLPIGILGLSQSETKKICSNHIDAMLASPGYAEQVSAGDQTPFVRQLLKVMQKYAKTESIVHDALKLHAIHYFMSHLITFTAASVQTIVQHLKRLKFPSTNLDQFPSSRLLSRQIKQIVHKLHVETTAKVLASVEKSLRKRTQDYWAPTFATILMLCLCMENLETAADTLVVCDKLRGEKAEGFEKTDSAKACKDLEDVPFAQCKNLLHEIYRSTKESTGGTKDAGFNPLRALSNSRNTGLKGEANEMVHEVSNIVCDNWSEVGKLAKRGSLEDSVNDVKPEHIRPFNTGRLASNFLMSFFPDE